MRILGLQKLTLLDFPGKTAATLFLGGCNFRCPFCHNAPLVVNPDFSSSLDKDELCSFFKKRQGILDGICITGGEPLLYPDIFDLVRLIKSYGYLVKIDTNGSFPAKLEQLISDSDIDYVAMDIKNAPSSYCRTIGLESFDVSSIRKSVEILMQDRVEYEFRTTVVREFHTESDFAEIGNWLGGAKRYFLQEFVDSGAVIEQDLHACTKNEMEHFAEIVRPKIPSVILRGVE